MAALDLDGVYTSDLRPLERQILEEKAKGLSDLEVASKFFLYEREVRSITQSLPRRHCQPGNRSKEEPSPVKLGEGHGRREDLEWAAPKNLPA